MGKSILHHVVYLLMSMIVVSCGGNDGNWKKTKEGGKIYYENDSFFDGKYSWSGDTLELGVAHGYGTFAFEDYFNHENDFKKKVEICYGAVVEPDSKKQNKVGVFDDKGRLQGFGVLENTDGKVLIGNFDDNKLDGYGVIYENGFVNYKGEVDNNLPDGDGIEYFPTGKIKYKGHFKKGLYNGEGQLNDSIGNKLYVGSFSKGLFNGFGVLYDSIGGQQSHVWSNGKLDKVTSFYYDKLAENGKNLSPIKLNKSRSRFLSWEKFHTWMYIGWSVFIVLFLLVCAYAAHEEDIKTRYNRIKQWNKYIIWLDWLFVGWLGCHRYALRSYYGLIYPVLISAIMIANMRELCLYLFYPSFWGVWTIGSFTYTCLILMVLFLIIDFFYIPWRCYELNHMYFRHDRNEELIKKNVPTDIMKFSTSLPQEAETNSNNISCALKAIKKVHDRKFTGKKDLLTKIGRALSGNDPWLTFEQNRAKALQRECKKAEIAQNEYAKLCEMLNVYLEESRRNAYRNFTLAKELISLAISTKKTKHELSLDEKIDDTRLALVSSFDNVCSIEAGMDWENTTNSAIETSTQLLSLGIRGPWAIGIGIGASLLGEAFHAVQKAQQACEEANKQCAEAINQLSHINDTIISSHAKILRSGEIIVALNKANEAFWHAYLPLRDEVFNTKPSFSLFIHGARVPDSLKNSPEFRQKVVHLIQVCSEYNKINQSKL